MEGLIFVVDSQQECREFICSSLEATRFTVRSFSALEPGANELVPPDLIIFGFHPEIDFVPSNRTFEGTVFSGIPRLVVIDGGPQENRGWALNLRADDWLYKPFSPSELLARVRTLLGGISRANDLIRGEIADIIIDSWAMKLSVRGQEITTTVLEFRLVEYLARHRGHVFTRDFLLDAVWGNMRFINPRSVDACIARIREKIEPDRTRPTMLKTVRGVGYRLDAITAWQSAPSQDCACAVCKARIGNLPMEALRMKRRKAAAEMPSP